jgi:hypothetical protein
MKRNVFAAAALLAFAGAASASPFGVYDASLTAGSPSFLDKLADPLFAPISSDQFAFAPSPGDVAVQYLGHSASYQNTLFQFSLANVVFNNYADALGAVKVVTNATSPLEFILKVDKFGDGSDVSYISSTIDADHEQIKLLSVGDGSFILGFEDIRLPDGDKDYNDMVFRVTVVPEPSTYALMLGGLGVAGWMARRRKRAE